MKSIADRIAVMIAARWCAGPDEQVLTPPFDAYTDLLLSSVPEMEIGWLDGVLAERAQIRAAAEMAQAKLAS